MWLSDRSLQPVKVWSTYRGHRRQVTVDIRGGRSAPPWRVVLTSGLYTTAGIAGGTFVGVAHSLGQRGSPDRITADILYFLGVPWLVVGVVYAVVLVRAIPDLWQRKVLEGAIVRHRVGIERSAYDGLEELRYYLAVDDGDSITLRGYPVGRERIERLGPSPYHYLAAGDVVRMTVAPTFGHVFRIHILHDRDGMNVPQIGTLPGTPAGAPVTAADVVRSCHLIVRNVEPVMVDNPAVRSWRYRLIDERDHDLHVHLATGPSAAEEIRALVRPEARESRQPKTLPGPASRYHSPHLLVVQYGSVAVGIQRSGIYPGLWGRWDEDLAQTALTYARSHTPHGDLGTPL